MKIVVTGGIGSGKSTVAIMLAQKLGFTYVSLDEIVHQFYEEPPIIEGLVALFGTSDRKLISDKVFRDPLKLKKLEEFFIPRVAARLAEYAGAYEDLVVEFPLYFEKGSNVFFDASISICSKMINRLQRVILRDNCTAEKLNSIIKHQITDEYRRINSDYIIENDGSLDELEAEVDKLVAKFKRDRVKRAVKDNTIFVAGTYVNHDVGEILNKLRARAVPKDKKIGLVSGSFDPITLGHTWVIQKALDIVDEVVIAVALNPTKKQLFTPEERGQLITDTMKEVLTPEQLARVTINYIKSDEMTVSYANHVGAKFIFRGLRNSTDFEYENQLNLLQKKIAPEIETIFLITPRELIEISSSLIKGAMGLREWERVAEPYVSKAVFAKLKEVSTRPTPERPTPPPSRIIKEDKS